MLRVITQVAVLAAAAGLAGCGIKPLSQCDGMVYTESGLTREQFRTCAAAMVKQLDRAQNALDVMTDKSKPANARQEARMKCLAATGDLSSLVRSAGGWTKLTAKWEDARLNEFSYEVMAARDYYTMVCYYRPKPFDEAGKPLTGGRDSSHESARRILAEIQ